LRNLILASRAEVHLKQEAMLRGGSVKKFLAIFVLAASACLPAAAQTAIRVNCGGAGYTDAKAQKWQADYSYNGGMVSSIAANVAGTPNQALYQTGRYAESSSKPLIYSFPVAAGSYHVNLYFAETFSSTQKPGARVFNVKVQGNTVFPNLDVFAAAGANSALVKSVDVIATSGTITIELDSIVQAAKINAIEIMQSLATPELKLNFMYPDGSPVSGTLNYHISTGSLTLGGKQPLTLGQAKCLLVASPALLGLVGPMQVNLSLTDTAGHSLWQIVLSLNPANANFAAVQSSALNVVVQKQ
jgi:hypothetical protein